MPEAASRTWDWNPPDSPFPRPFDRPFYEDLQASAAAASWEEPQCLEALEPAWVHVGAGRLVEFRLLEGPQMVGIFPMSAADPDERIWIQDMCLIEGIFLRPFTRLWGIMPRYRPMLTCLTDTVASQRRPGEPVGHHHCLWAGWETPLDWSLSRGDPAIPSSWEQMAAGLEQRDFPASMLADYPTLFQKIAVDGPRQRLEILPSDAVAGDRVDFFSEIDLDILVALSPYVDGSRPASEVSADDVRPLQVTISQPLKDPLPWPYDGLRYPDLSLYLDKNGQRTDKPEITAGIYDQLSQ